MVYRIGDETIMILIKDDKLEHKIYQLRKELIQIAEKTGLNSPDTICYSQKLDQFITIYQKTSLLKKRKLKYVVREMNSVKN